MKISHNIAEKNAEYTYLKIVRLFVEYSLLIAMLYVSTLVKVPLLQLD